MTNRLLYIDPESRCQTLIRRLQATGISCRSLTDSPRDMLEVMLENNNTLLVVCENMVRTPMIAAASSWMTVVAFEMPFVTDTHWITLSPNDSEDDHLEILLGLLKRGDHGRRRTRIVLPLKIWIQGICYSVSNASLKELWIEEWNGPPEQREFDGVLELPDDRGKVLVRTVIVAERNDGCALRFTPSNDVGLLSWLDYFLERLQQTPVNERVEPFKEFFDEN